MIHSRIRDFMTTKRTTVTALRILCALCFSVALPGAVVAQTPVETASWTDFYGGKTGLLSINGQPAKVGTVVEAFDPTGVLCGQYFVSSSGKYGFMPVYGDDPQTAGVDEGPIPGEAISFTLAGLPAVMSGPDNNSWVAGPTTEKEVNLAVTGAVYGLQLILAPTDKYGIPGETLTFGLTFKNTGNVTDFYTLNVTSLLGWPLETPLAPFYVKSGLGNQTVLFRVTIPAGALNLADELNFSLQSGMDPSLVINGSLNAFATATDVGDDNPLLPNAFAVGQNYPNPFNPTTTIPYKLGSAGRVSLVIVDVLGRIQQNLDLGVQSVGAHDFAFDASGLASGLYFYRLESGATRVTKMMTLLK